MGGGLATAGKNTLRQQQRKYKYKYTANKVAWRHEQAETGRECEQSGERASCVEFEERESEESKRVLAKAG